jgi:hypothetical protein
MAIDDLIIFMKEDGFEKETIDLMKNYLYNHPLEVAFFKDLFSNAFMTFDEDELKEALQNAGERIIDYKITGLDGIGFIYKSGA